MEGFWLTPRGAACAQLEAESMKLCLRRMPKVKPGDGAVTAWGCSVPEDPPSPPPSSSSPFHRWGREVLFYPNANLSGGEELGYTPRSF